MCGCSVIFILLDFVIYTNIINIIVETLSIITDVLCSNVTGVRLIHHVIQALLSKSIGIHEWLHGGLYKFSKCVLFY